MKYENKTFRNIAIALSLLIAVPSLGATAKLRRTKNVRMYAGTGVGSGYGLYGVPLNFGLRFRPQKGGRFWFGADTGITIGMGFAVPLLASVSLDLNEKEKKLRPYVGASVGPVISLLGYGYYNAYNFLVDDSRMSVGHFGFGMLLRPGVSWSISKKLDLNFEAPFGVVGAAFYMAPQANLQFHL